MPTVQIPAEHFIKNAKKYYNDIRTAIFREFLQNSVDAKSSKIEFELGDDYLICRDNGVGMSKDRMVEALLTMGGSVKEEGSIGGFGAAKEIILFQHDSYEIHSLDTHVKGVVLEYEFIDGTYINGTEIKITFNPSFEYDKSYFISIATDYFKTCQTNANIFLNGEKIPSLMNRGDLVRTFDWSNIYAKKRTNTTCRAYVRSNGVNMFYAYVSDVKYDIIIELTKQSTEILTATRDGFNRIYSDHLSKLITEINLESNSFGKLFGKIFTYVGECSYYIDMIKKVSQNYNIDDKVFESVYARINDGTITDENDVLTALANLKESKSGMIIDELEKQFKCYHKSNFTIFISGKGINTIPKNINPLTMTFKYIKLAKLWKLCIKTVLEATETHIPYNIGWVLDKDLSITALYKKKDDIHSFLINPFVDWKSSRQLFHKLLISACHEVTHITDSYHNEYFTTKFGNIVEQTLDHVGKVGWRTIMSNIKNEKL